MLPELFKLIIDACKDKIKSKTNDRSKRLCLAILYDIYHYRFELDIIRASLDDLRSSVPFSQQVPDIIKQINTNPENHKPYSGFDIKSTSTWFKRNPHGFSVDIIDIPSDEMPYDTDWYEATTGEIATSSALPSTALRIGFTLSPFFRSKNLGALFNVLENKIEIPIDYTRIYDQLAAKGSAYHTSKALFDSLYSISFTETFYHEFRHACSIEGLYLNESSKLNWIMGIIDRAKKRSAFVQNGFMLEFYSKPFDTLAFSSEYRLLGMNSELRKMIQSSYLSFCSGLIPGLDKSKQFQAVSNLAFDAALPRFDVIIKRLATELKEDQNQAAILPVLNRATCDLLAQARLNIKNEGSIISLIQNEIFARTMLQGAFILNKGANQGLSLSNLTSRVAAPGPRAVIIKGDPYFIAKDPDGYDAFYKEIKDILLRTGYENVIFDDGEPKSATPDAELWLGHSRGKDRLKWAPAGTITLAIDDYEDPDDTYSSELADVMRQYNTSSIARIPVEARPIPRQNHYTVTNSLRQAIEQLYPIAYSRNTSLGYDMDSFYPDEANTYRMNQAISNALLGLVGSSLDRVSGLMHPSSRLLYSSSTSITRLENDFDTRLASNELPFTLAYIYRNELINVTAQVAEYYSLTNAEHLELEGAIRKDLGKRGLMQGNNLKGTLILLSALAYDIALKSPIALAFEQLSLAKKQGFIHDYLVNGTMFEANREAMAYSLDICSARIDDIHKIPNLDNVLCQRLTGTLAECFENALLESSIYSKCILHLLGNEAIKALDDKDLTASLRLAYDSCKQGIFEFINVASSLLQAIGQQIEAGHSPEFRYEIDEAVMAVQIELVRCKGPMTEAKIAAVLKKSKLWKLLTDIVSQHIKVLRSFFKLSDTKLPSSDSLQSIVEAYAGFDSKAIAALSDIPGAACHFIAQLILFKNGEFDSITNSDAIFGAEYQRLLQLTKHIEAAASLAFLDSSRANEERMLLVESTLYLMLALVMSTHTLLNVRPA